MQYIHTYIHTYICTYHKQVFQVSHFFRKMLDISVVADIQTGQGAELSYFLRDLNQESACTHDDIIEINRCTYICTYLLELILSNVERFQVRPESLALGKVYIGDLVSCVPDLMHAQ